MTRSFVGQDPLGGGGLAGTTVTVQGTGGSGTGSFNLGVSLFNSRISALGQTAVSVVGQGGANGTQSNIGIELTSSSGITAAAGGVSMLGTGGGGALVGTLYNHGVSMLSASFVTTTNSGNVSLVGIGGRGTNYNMGVALNGSSINASGDLDLDGIASASTTGSYNHGVYLYRGIFDLDALALSTIHGIGGGGLGRNHGIFSSLSDEDGAIMTGMVVDGSTTSQEVVNI